jgi:hypothetical protein
MPLLAGDAVVAVAVDHPLGAHHGASAVVLECRRYRPVRGLKTDEPRRVLDRAAPITISVRIRRPEQEPPEQALGARLAQSLPSYLNEIARRTR